jgi:signal transduction histidine kinase
MLWRALEWERLLREREAARAQALALAQAEANRRMEELLGIAAHELKAPVTSSRLGVALAARRVSDLVDQVAARDTTSGAQLAFELDAIHGLLTRAEEGLARLTRLMVDLLDVPRIRGAGSEPRLAPCNLASVVREAVEEQRRIAPARTIRLHPPDRGSVPVVADADRIGQVVTNYLTNALRYSPADRPVDVCVQARRDWARVAVRDEGPGLAHAERRRIWERFYRAAGGQVTGDAAAGLGLGLYICKTIIEQHRGRVGLRSAPGMGSTFWFALALVAVDRNRVGRIGDP